MNMSRFTNAEGRTDIMQRKPSERWVGQNIAGKITVDRDRGYG